MKTKITSLLLLVFVGQFPHALKGQGQIRGANLMEFQLGNLPQLEPKSQSSLYNQLNVSYRNNPIGLNIRAEQYYPSFGENIRYTRLSQFKLQYNTHKLDVDVGHLYTTLGRGLLLRTYEIPGSVWETRGFRSRYGFYKDLLGASVKFSFNNFEIKAVRGEILDVALPPTLEDNQNRRPDLIEGIETSYQLKSNQLGLIVMRNKSTGNEDFNHFLSAYFKSAFLQHFSLYAEIAKALSVDLPLHSFSDDANYAGYVGLSYSVLNFGMSLEVKDYHNFFLGTGINDPPALVKEHPYRLLNRSTHVPVLTDESGYQAELYYTLKSGNIITLNTSLSKNEISESIRPVFREYFVEYQFYGKKNISGKAFIDYANDPFVNENHRYASGGSIDITHKKLNSNIEMEWQWISRNTEVRQEALNAYLGYTLSKTSKYSASIVAELTTDPSQLQANKTYNFYPSLSLSYRPDQKNIIRVFYGKRRGGPACNSGVCYDVLDFEGLEMRLTTRF